MQKRKMNINRTYQIDLEISSQGWNRTTAHIPLQVRNPLTALRLRAVLMGIWSGWQRYPPIKDHVCHRYHYSQIVGLLRRNEYPHGLCKINN